MCGYFLIDLLVKDLKLFRIIVRLRGLTAIFWDMARFMNQSLVSLRQALADYICWKNTYLNFLKNFI